MIGTFWNIFGKDALYEESSFRMLNELLLSVWLRNMVDIVSVNAGSVYQMTPRDR